MSLAPALTASRTASFVRFVYGITSTAVGAAASWSAFRGAAEALYFAANATNESVRGQACCCVRKSGTQPDDDLITGTAVSECGDRLVKNIGDGERGDVVECSPRHLDRLAGCKQGAADHDRRNGVAPIFVGTWGAIDLIRDPYSETRHPAWSAPDRAGHDGCFGKPRRATADPDRDLSNDEFANILWRILSCALPVMGGAISCGRFKYRSRATLSWMVAKMVAVLRKRNSCPVPFRTRSIATTRRRLTCFVGYSFDKPLAPKKTGTLTFRR